MNPVSKKKFFFLKIEPTRCLSKKGTLLCMPGGSVTRTEFDHLRVEEENHLHSYPTCAVAHGPRHTHNIYTYFNLKLEQSLAGSHIFSGYCSYWHVQALLEPPRSEESYNSGPLLVHTWPSFGTTASPGICLPTYPSNNSWEDRGPSIEEPLHFPDCSLPFLICWYSCLLSGLVCLISTSFLGKLLSVP